MSGSKVVFVGNIPYEQTEEQLIEIFTEVGPVVSFRLVFERETGKPRGYGFCEFQDERTAASAVRNLNGREIGNRSLKVDYAETDPARRDIEEGSFMRNIGPGSGSAGPPPPMPPHLQQQQQQQQQQLPQPPFMPPQGAPSRMDPRIAMNPNVAPPPNRPPVPQQPMVGGPPPPPMGGGPNSADAISAVLASMTPKNVFDLISSMKVLGASEPDRAKAVLNENPQLSYALFQALLMMNLVEPSSLQRMFPAMPGRDAPAQNAPVPQQHLPPPPPPPIQHMGMPPPGQFAPPGYPNMMPPGPQLPQPPQAAAMGASLEQQQALLAQVMALTPAEIAGLPEEQRANIIQLRAQLRGANI